MALLKTGFFLMLLFSSVFFHTCQTWAIEEAQDKNVRFKWAFIHKTPHSEERIIDFKQQPVVTSGDMLRIYLQLQENAYIYIYLLDSQKELALIFPSPPDYYEKNHHIQNACYLPGENEWFRIDDSKGVEKFYLLASNERLLQLESITSAYLQSNRSAEIKADLLSEIKSIRNRYSKLTSRAEKGIPIAGTVKTRGLPPTPEATGAVTQVEAEDFYGKTLRLIHE